jgi:hypothetical protein
VGKWRRAVTVTLASNQACTTVALSSTMGPTNATHLPRSTNPAYDLGTLAANLPFTAITTGEIDAIECVLYKAGVSQGEFGNPGTGARFQLYRGSGPAGMRIDNNTPGEQTLYTSLSTLESYDQVIADCKGGNWDSDFSEAAVDNDNIRIYLNSGGREFNSHLSFSQFATNGTTPYSAQNPIATGLEPAASWDDSANASENSGTGFVDFTNPLASPRINQFATWLVNVGVLATTTSTFTIFDPRSQILKSPGPGPSSEVFLNCNGGDCSGNDARVQQMSFNTPYGAPGSAACGRVAYSGFHVQATAGSGSSPYANTIFPSGCGGTLTNQEKVLLWQIFDVGTCLGNQILPTCTPVPCSAIPGSCGLTPDGCGNTQDCACAVQ